MPVIDHPVHPSTSKGLDWRYGCHNGPSRSEGYWAHPWAKTGERWVPFRMSHGCAYDLSANDPACEGCSRRKGL